MMTMRSHDQFNTTIYGLDDRYRGIHNGRRVVFLNPEDIRSSELKDGQLVDLVSHFDGEERIARQFTVVPYSIPRRCAATYFPEANVLVPLRHFADKSHTPASKSVVISIRRRDERDEIFATMPQHSAESSGFPARWFDSLRQCLSGRRSLLFIFITDGKAEPTALC